MPKNDDLAYIYSILVDFAQLRAQTAQTKNGPLRIIALLSPIKTLPISKASHARKSPRLHEFGRQRSSRICTP